MSYKLPYTGEELYNKLVNEFALKSDITPQFEDLYNTMDGAQVFRGYNPITSADEDTVDFWRNALPGIYYFSNGNTTLGISQWGILTHKVVGVEIQQEYIAAPGGYNRFFRGANGNGWGGANKAGSEAWYRLTATAVSS